MLCPAEGSPGVYMQTPLQLESQNAPTAGPALSTTIVS